MRPGLELDDGRLRSDGRFGLKDVGEGGMGREGSGSVGGLGVGSNSLDHPVMPSRPLASDNVLRRSNLKLVSEALESAARIDGVLLPAREADRSLSSQLGVDPERLEVVVVFQPPQELSEVVPIRNEVESGEVELGVEEMDGREERNERVEIEREESMGVLIDVGRRSVRLDSERKSRI